MEKRFTYKELTEDSFLPVCVSRVELRVLGAEKALLFTAIAEQEDFSRQQGLLIGEEEWDKFRRNFVWGDTGIEPENQTKVLNELSELGLIKFVDIGGNEFLAKTVKGGIGKLLKEVCVDE